jgi:prolipoprotein diacylglyceryltransferase
MDSFQLGPLNLKISWLFLLASVYLAYIMIDAMINKDQNIKKTIFYELLTNSILIIFITFKFSFILFRPSIVWENPLGIIYFTGGNQGLFLGILLSVIYLLIKFKAHQFNEWRYWKLLIYGIATFIASYYIVQTVYTLLI